MRNSRNLIFETILFALSIIVIPGFIVALRNVSVTIPLAAKRGDNAILICNYDIENDTLYTVKWYRGRREFYRYTPKENPAWKIFPSTNGLNVDINQSNASHVFLRNVSTTISGRYACEVSADAPSFHTVIMWGDMDVTELPIQRPIITGVHSRYRLGDVINGNCSSDYSKPAANLTWWINDIQVPPNYLRVFEIQKHIDEQLESSVLEINFVVTLQHFLRGRLKLKCSARIYRIYHAETEKYIEEDKPRILASGRSPETYPYDHKDEFDDENDIYLTHYKNSSAQSNLLNLNRIKRLMYILLPAISSLLFGIFYKNMSNPVREFQQQQQYVTRFAQSRKTSRILTGQRQSRHHLQQSQHQLQLRQFYTSFSNNNNHNNKNEDYFDCNHNNGTAAKITPPTTKTMKIKAIPSLRQSPYISNKNGKKLSCSLERQRHAIIAMNTDKIAINNIQDMGHVIR